eukprot:2254008-Amphidinium_carterae.1
MQVLGADFSINSGFQVGLAGRAQRSTRTWYVHKQILINTSVDFEDRYSTASSISQSSLFWGLVASPITAVVKQRVNSQALAETTRAD